MSEGGGARLYYHLGHRILSGWGRNFILSAIMETLVRQLVFSALPCTWAGALMVNVAGEFRSQPSIQWGPPASAYLSRL